MLYLKRKRREEALDIPIAVEGKGTTLTEERMVDRRLSIELEWHERIYLHSNTYFNAAMTRRPSFLSLTVYSRKRGERDLHIHVISPVLPKA